MKVYKNRKEYIDLRDSIYNNIKDCIYKWIVTDKFEYTYMFKSGLTTRQEINLKCCLEYNLFKLSNNKEWSQNISFSIVNGISGFFYGMINIGVWENIYLKLEAKQIADMIYENIIFQLDDDKHSPYYLEEIIRDDDSE